MVHNNIGIMPSVSHAFKVKDLLNVHGLFSVEVV